MDIGYTYASSDGIKGSWYVPPGVDVPTLIKVRIAGDIVDLHRLSDRDLTCDDVPGIPQHCDSYECHRVVLGDCVCGRHQAPIPFSRVSA